MITAGKALYWGTSEWTAAEIAAAWHIADKHHLHKPVMEQPQYNLLHRERVEKEYARLYADIGLGHDDLEPARLGPAHRQVQRRHPAGLARHGQGLRVAAGAPHGPGQAREGAQARADREGPRLHARADVARVVPQEPARFDRDHRRKPAVAGRENMRALDVVPKLTPDVMAQIDERR
jgi:aryl-alcohol dehydrogenase-like predicted oxidoreductase